MCNARQAGRVEKIVGGNKASEGCRYKDKTGADPTKQQRRSTNVLNQQLPKKLPVLFHPGGEGSDNALVEVRTRNL